MTEKIPISFNEDDIIKINELAKLMGIAGVYGDTPKAVKFGIRLALASIKTPEKVYGSLNDDEVDIYFQSIARNEKQNRAAIKANKILETAQKV